MPKWKVAFGKVGRNEASGLVVYKTGETIEMSAESAVGYGQQLEPADRAAQLSRVDIVTPIPDSPPQQQPGQSRPLPEAAGVHVASTTPVDTASVPAAVERLRSGIDVETCPAPDSPPAARTQQRAHHDATPPARKRR